MLNINIYCKAAVPLLAVQTADPAEVVRAVMSYGEKSTEAKIPILLWDVMHGIIALNDSGKDPATDLNDGKPEEASIITGRPDEALRSLETKLTKSVIIVFHGLADMIKDPAAGIVVRQALWNLRDILKSTGTLLIMTVPLGWKNPFPNDIAVDVMPFPTRDEIKDIVTSLLSSTGLELPKDLNPSIDALTGLSSYAVEQTTALSLSKKGINMESMRARKRQQIRETDGLSVYAGKEKFDDLGGVEQAKKMFRDLLKGKRKPGAIVFIDEGEKALAAAQTDTSGVAQDQSGCLLSYMQDNEATGSIFIGPPGAAKSAFAKAVGNEGEIPTVMLDLGALKGSLVGESEAKVRAALAVITSISGGRPFFIMTCNSIGRLTPEMKRRYTMGTFFFDLPDENERKVIWTIWMKKFDIPNQKLPDSEGWTGAEIKQCCDLADRLGITLKEAAQYVVPVSVSAKEAIETLRKEANGRYLSASYPDKYKYSALKTSGGRNIRLSN